MSKDQTVKVLLDKAEKKGFEKAAELAGLPLGTYMRVRLRAIVSTELGRAGVRVPFLNEKEKDHA